MKAIHFILTAGIALAMLTASALALTLPVSEDSSTSGNAGVAKSAGGENTLRVSASRQGLIRFEAGAFADSLSAGEVTKARLVFYITSVTAPGALTLHRVTQDWSEDGASSPAYEAAPLATIPQSSVIAKQFVIVDVTAAVQAWLREPGTDFGFAIVGSGGARVLLGSKEGAATGHPAQLQIETDAVFLDEEDAAEGGRTRASATGPIGNFVTNADVANNSLKGKKLKDASLLGKKLAMATITADKLDATIGLWTAAGANVVRAAGNVGIATSTPLAPLDINFDGRVDDNKPALIVGPSGSFHVEFDGEQIQAASKSPAKTNPSDLLLNFNGGNVLVGSTMSVGGIATFANNVGIGTTSPATGEGTVLEVSSTGTAGTAIIDTNYGGGPSLFIGRKARGTAAAPTAVQANDELAYFAGRGYNGTAFTAGSRALMVLSASQNWTATANGAEISLRVTPNNTVASAEAVRIKNDGKVGLATTTPLSLLHVSLGSNISLGQPAFIVGEAINTGGIAQGQHLEFDRLGIQAGSAFPANTLANANTLSLNPQGGSVTVNGQVVATGEENLRIIRGRFGANGAVLRGTGFTAARNSQGNYTITFSTSFSGVPTVAFQPEAVYIAGPPTTPDATNNTATVRVFQVTGTGPVLSDPNFIDFIATGPR